MPSGPTMAPESANSNPSIQSPVQARRALLKEIGAKWGKFSEAELAALQNNDDLVSHVVAKYSLEKTTAQGDVDVLMHGRRI